MNLPMHHPLRLYNDRPPAPRKPQVRDYQTEDYRFIDGRKALGSVPHQPHWPTLPCEFCWPALITAMTYVDDGKACCPECANNPNRVARLPALARRALQ